MAPSRWERNAVHFGLKEQTHNPLWPAPTGIHGQTAQQQSLSHGRPGCLEPVGRARASAVGSRPSGDVVHHAIATVAVPCTRRNAGSVWGIWVAMGHLLSNPVHSAHATSMGDRGVKHPGPHRDAGCSYLVRSPFSGLG